MVRFTAHRSVLNGIALLCGIAMAASATGGAFAADPPEKWLPDSKQRFTELVSGWYARGDIGWRQQKIGSVDAPAPFFATEWSLDNTPSFGGGGGYKYKWFRMDATLDYASLADFRANTATTADYYTAKLDSFTLLANMYLDLGEWYGITPYVGAGVGMSNLRVHQYTNLSIIEPQDGVVDQSRWSFSWALTGGIAYQFASNLVLDVNYRYLNLGEAHSGPEPPAYTNRSYFRDITAQEVRIGLRLLLD
jgi:opacity protein-like surface antigen